MTDPSPPVEQEEPPPFLERWANVYVVLLVELFLLVAAFYVLTRWAS